MYLLQIMDPYFFFFSFSLTCFSCHSFFLLPFPSPLLDFGGQADEGNVPAILLSSFPFPLSRPTIPTIIHPKMLNQMN